ncbi:hypothetical protein BXZ70DRAFT_947732 [Cristinia sonorae]|uniref:Uncharacterized protein n=1 Tax=Cristinia sonorae TaxID=1940300 RepID=A0A8K0UKC0_9AGAR|nr:hypothetical protein BXZ70DRAFT_947732 [Cristinia sonorae]
MHAMFSTLLAAIAASNFVAVLGSPITTDVSIIARSNSGAKLRLPPFLDAEGHHESSYKSLPEGWAYGNWKETYSSQPAYLELQNYEFDSYPLVPQSEELPGQNVDLLSWTLENDTTLYTQYGIDTPKRSSDKSLGPNWDDVFDYVPTGDLSDQSNSYAYLAWGYDTDGVEYTVIYETAIAATGSPACIDIESRSTTGPSKETYDEIVAGLFALDNEEITELTRELEPLVHNGARDGFGPVECDEACRNNTLPE